MHTIPLLLLIAASLDYTHAVTIPSLPRDHATRRQSPTASPTPPPPSFTPTGRLVRGSTNCEYPSFCADACSRQYNFVFNSDTLSLFSVAVGGCICESPVFTNVSATATNIRIPNAIGMSPRADQHTVQVTLETPFVSVACEGTYDVTVGTFLSASALPPNDDGSSSSKSTTLIIVLSCSGALLVVTLVAIAVYCCTYGSKTVPGHQDSELGRV